MIDAMSDTRIDAKFCAQTIKAELKQHWPTVRFSVRSKIFTTGGIAVDVKWTYGPTRRQVESVIDKYQHGDVDGMTDSYVYRKTSTLVSAKYVSAEHRGIPWEVWLQIQQDYTALLGVKWRGEDTRAHGQDIATLTWRLLERFEMPGDGYHGLAKAMHSDTNSGDELESLYEVVGGKRIALE